MNPDKSIKEFKTELDAMKQKLRKTSVRNPKYEEILKKIEDLKSKI